MSGKLPVCSTTLAHWLNDQMGKWQDGVTALYGMSQQALANATGIPQAQIHAVLKKGRIPKANTLDKLADFFGEKHMALYKIAYAPGEAFD